MDTSITKPGITGLLLLPPSTTAFTLRNDGVMMFTCTSRRLTRLTRLPPFAWPSFAFAGRCFSSPTGPQPQRFSKQAKSNLQLVRLVRINQLRCTSSMPKTANPFAQRPILMVSAQPGKRPGTQAASAGGCPSSWVCVSSVSNGLRLATRCIFLA